MVGYISDGQKESSSALLLNANTAGDTVTSGAVLFTDECRFVLDVKGSGEAVENIVCPILTIPTWQECAGSS